MEYSDGVKSALSTAALSFFTMGLVSRPACATTAIGTFGVNATVQAECLVSAAVLAFGTHPGVVAAPTPAVSVDLHATQRRTTSASVRGWRGRSWPLAT